MVGGGSISSKHWPKKETFYLAVRKGDVNELSRYCKDETKSIPREKLTVQCNGNNIIMPLFGTIKFLILI